MELTILMPCLNESSSVVFCIQQALAYLKSREITGEVLIADNGSSDGSRELALAAGARVITVLEKVLVYIIWKSAGSAKVMYFSP